MAKTYRCCADRRPGRHPTGSRESDQPSHHARSKWDAPATRELAQRACFDCHSNETTWPWYGYIAPVSWRLADHINEGRGVLNFSTWDQPNTDLDEVVENIEENEMPLSDFLLMHPEAKLTAAEKTTLIAGFKATFSQDPPIARAEGAGRD